MQLNKENNYIYIYMCVCVYIYIYIYIIYIYYKKKSINKSQKKTIPSWTNSF